MIKHPSSPPNKHLFLLHCFRMYCFRENPQTSIALHCFAVLQASTWAWHVAVQQSQRRGQPPRVQPLCHTGQQNPDPVTHACDMSRQRLIWSYSNSHLLHLAYDRATRTALKPVLDWALKSSEVCKSRLGGKQCFAQLFPPTTDKSRAMKTLCYDHFINFHWDRDALLLSQSQNQAHSTVCIS